MFDLKFHKKFNDILSSMTKPVDIKYLNENQSCVSKKYYCGDSYRDSTITHSSKYNTDEVKYVYDYAVSIGLKIINKPRCVIKKTDNLYI